MLSSNVIGDRDYFLIWIIWGIIHRIIIAYWEDVWYNGSSPSGGMIFLNNHVKGFRGLLPWKYRIRFYPPCNYYREYLAIRAFMERFGKICGDLVYFELICRKVS